MSTTRIGCPVAYVLLQTPAARCEHFQTVTSRMSSHQLMRMNLGNQFYLHRKNMPQDARHVAALWWGLLGLFVLNVGRALFKNDPGLVTGMIVGAVEQAGGRGSDRPRIRAGAPVTALEAAGGAKKRDYRGRSSSSILSRSPWFDCSSAGGGSRRTRSRIVSLVLGLAVGPFFALANRGGLIAGAIVYYLSFVFDCVDGKLARLLGVKSPRGQAFDALADGARRGSAVIGLGFYVVAHRTSRSQPSYGSWPSASCRSTSSRSPAPRSSPPRAALGAGGRRRWPGDGCCRLRACRTCRRSFSSSDLVGGDRARAVRGDRDGDLSGSCLPVRRRLRVPVE